MKIAIALVLITLSSAVILCERMHVFSTLPESATVDELKVGSDGTATVAGIVLENNHGCEVDASCYLQLRIGNKDIRVVYHPGAAERVVNTVAVKEGYTVKHGDHIKAYGRYRKQENKDIIETYTSGASYIRVLSTSAP
jgi:hypothetical protein